jgi:hypothetical protein
VKTEEQVTGERSNNAPSVIQGVSTTSFAKVCVNIRFSLLQVYPQVN